MRWKQRCLVDGLKAILPAQQQLRGLKRALCGFQPERDKDRATLEDGLRQIEWVQAKRPVAGSRVLEIGSGWQPIIPLLFSLAGARRVYMTDLNRLCHNSSLESALELFRESQSQVTKRLGDCRAVWEQVTAGTRDKSLEERLESLNLEYLAPCDARKTVLKPDSVDCVISRAVFEHIPREVLMDILVEMRRIVKPGGVMCHFIDNSDHWEHQDKTISKVNFLQYSDSKFKWTQLNGLNYQNRLRHSDYADIFQLTGWVTEREERIVDPAALKVLEDLPLAERFQGKVKDDLATITSFFLLRKPVPE